MSQEAQRERIFMPGLRIAPQDWKLGSQTERLTVLLLEKYHHSSCWHNPSRWPSLHRTSQGPRKDFPSDYRLVIEQKPENPARIVTLSPYGCYSYVTGFEWLCGPWIVHLSSSKGISWPFSMTLGERLLNEK